MLAQYAENWWAFLLRGIIGILFGLLLLINPVSAGLAIVLVIGVFALVDGVFAIVGSIMNRKEHPNWWVMLLQGVLSVLFGLMAIFAPGITGLAIIWVIAAWAIVIGVLGIWAGITLRKEIEGELWLILWSVLLVLFGILSFLDPIQGGGILLTIWGILAIMGGVFSLLLAFRLRGMKGQVGSGRPATT